MAIGTAFHYVGSALLFIAMVLTIVVDISVPVTDNISMVDFDLPGQANAKFGVFGYCYKEQSGDSQCSSSRIGYSPADVLERVDDSANFSNLRDGATEALTHALVLHPVGTVILFFAFLLSLIPNSTVGGIIATLASGLAFVVNAVAVIISWVTFSLIMQEIEDGDGNASYGPAIIIALVATVITLVATILMFVTCCAGRRSRRRESRKMTQY